MKKIKTVGIIGLGALGTLYAHLLTQALGKEHVLVLADEERVRRYRQEPLYFNEAPCDFNYTVASQVSEPVDLLLFAVKFGGLASAADTCRHLVGPETTLISILNGISSEEFLAEQFSPQQIVWCVAQKMSAKKDGQQVTVSPYGELALGVPDHYNTEHLQRLIALFDEIRFPYSLPDNIRRHMWGKLLCNTGCNQATMVFQCGYAGIHRPGEVRDACLGAMREVVSVAKAEGVSLSEEDVQHWISIIDTLPGNGEPSMRQDSKAHRKSEVELFSGTIRRLAKAHNIPVPVNDWFYQKIQEMEASYS